MLHTRSSSRGPSGKAVGPNHHACRSPALLRPYVSPGYLPTAVGPAFAGPQHDWNGRSRQTSGVPCSSRMLVSADASVGTQTSPLLRDGGWVNFFGTSLSLDARLALRVA